MSAGVVSMLEETHRYLAVKLVAALDIENRFWDSLIDGSVVPDFQENFPHIGKEDAIMRLLHSSRRDFLAEDQECYYLLGLAFHYIQDKWTLRPRTGDEYTQWEKRIAKEKIAEDNGFKNLIKQASIPPKFKKAYVTFADILTNGIESPTFWQEIMNSKKSLLELREEFLEPKRKKDSFGKRVIAVAAFAIGEEYGKPTSRLLAFEKILQDSGVRFTTPLIDLNMAFLVCKAVGERLLSKKYAWAE